MSINELMKNFTVRSTYIENTTSPMNFSFNGSASLMKESVSDLGSPFTKLKLSFQLVIALFGIFGNILVYFVIREMKKKKSTTDIVVQNLAIADLGIFLLTFPLVAIKERMPWNWPFGEFACLYLYPIPDIFYGASVWCITVIALDRYRRMITPRIHSQNEHRILLERAKYIVACVWGISFLVLCLPLYFVVEYQNKLGTWCGPVWSTVLLAQAYIALLTIFLYILPLIVISWTYLVISRTIQRSSTFIKSLKREDVTKEDKDCCSLTQNPRLRQNKRAKKILTPMVMVFAITMLPLNVLRLTIALWTALGKQGYYENLLYTVSVFVMLNSAANPVIYSIASKDFRRRVKNLCNKEPQTKA